MRILLVTAFTLVLGFHAAQAQTTPQYSMAGYQRGPKSSQRGRFNIIPERT